MRRKAVGLNEQRRLRTGLLCSLLTVSFHAHRRYLCAKEQQAASIKQKGMCEVSTDFTKHYGHTVYVCQGAPVKDIHGDAWDPSSRT